MPFSDLRSPLARTAAVVVLAGAAAACGSSGSGGGGGSGGSGAADNPVISRGHAVTAVETEFKITLSRTSMPAGTYTFDAENQGSTTHALTVNGPGVSNKSTGDVQPGQTGSVTVTLQPGSYDVYCPVADHKMLGMDTHITVT